MSHSSRLTKLEAAQPRKTTPRVIVLDDGRYYERGQILSAAEYQAIVSDPSNSVTLCEIVRTDKQSRQ
jgi:hypothetical protein